MSKIAYSVTNESVTVVNDGRPTVVKRTSPNFMQLRLALIEERWDDALAHLRADTSLTRWARGRFTVVDSMVCFDGVPVPSDLNGRIIEMATANEDPTPLFSFWERLQRNPSHRSVEQLWRFLALRGIPLTEDGHFLAYKGVRTDFKDCHSGTIDNHPGQLVQVPRNQVSDDPQTACHFGLHVGSLEYASSFGQRVVICKVDPEHVVCVPYDSSSQKMRVCEYEVIGQHGGGHMPSTMISDEDWEEEDADWSDVMVDGVSWNDFYDEDLTDELAPWDDDGEAPDVEPKTFFLNERQELPDPQTPTKKTPKWVRDLDAKSETELMDVNMDVLRKYASKVLRIVGASRLAGGKLGLVEAISHARV